MRLEEDSTKRKRKRCLSVVSSSFRVFFLLGDFVYVVDSLGPAQLIWLTDTL